MEIKIIENLCERSLREGDRYALNYSTVLRNFDQIVILITIHQKRERRKRLNRNKSDFKRPFNNTLLSIKVMKIIRIITVRLA